jgi:hypothetical protein
MSPKDSHPKAILGGLINCPLTRRDLMRGALGAGITVAGIGSGADTGNADEGGKGKERLAAACGTYCGACPSYIATHSEDGHIQRSNPWGDCDGCLGGGKLAAHCRACRIRLCAASKRSVTRCSDCEELPCYRITSLINAGGYPHREEYLPNLAAIREVGVQDWVRNEEERWRCPKCRLPMSWYDTRCARCGEPRSETLFPVSEDTPLPY